MTVKIAETRWGRQIYLSNDVYVGPLLEHYGEYSYGETHLFVQFIRPGDVVVDAGAHIGCHTLALAKLVGATGTVLAFEPQPPIYQMLCGTMALNECWHVKTFRAALGDARGTVKIPPVQYDAAENFGSVVIGHGGDTDVPMVPLDDFELASLRFIKIDVEGCEARVLRGARETIRRHRPYLYVENDRKDSSAEVIETLLGYEYRVYLHTPPLFVPENFRGCREDLFPGVAAIMLFGAPAEEKLVITGAKPIERPEDMIELNPHVVTDEMRSAVLDAGRDDR